MPAGWNQTSGTVREGPIDEDTFWMLFNYVFSDSSAKRTTYKFGLLKSILDNLFNSEGKDYSLFISYENLFGKFAENYWNLVTKYHLRQMIPDGKSEYSKIEQIFMGLIEEEPSFTDIPFTSIPEHKRKSIIKQVSSDCRKNVIGALHRDFQDCLYAFDLKGEGIYLNGHAFNFMLKYKVEIEKLNYYSWAKFLEKINDESVVVKLLEKLELATPQRDDLFAMMDQVPEEIFGEINSDTEENLPNNARTRIINTDLEVGEEFYFEVNPKTTDETEKSFLPKVAGKKCYIPFLLGTNDSIKYEAESSDSEFEAMAQAFLSSSKCRVMIGKNILKNIETAYFEGKGGQNYSIPVFDYGESYCLEIPFVILYGNNMLNLERIVIIQE